MLNQRSPHAIVTKVSNVNSSNRSILLSFSTCSYSIGNNDICFLTSRFRGFKGLLPSFLSNMRSANDPKPMQSKFNLTHSCHIKNKNNKQETHMVYDLNYARFEKCLR